MSDPDTLDELASAPTHDSLDPEVHIGSSESIVPRPSSDRFEPHGILGVGGMGKVELIRDAWIGREVARKTLAKKRRTDPKALNAFMREAKIQGQLEHPAVVPVHDLGFDSEGAPYFTMKRVRGRTLRELLDAEERPPRRRLLEAFHRVCLSVDYAHARGVIHRDLKPENVMLGDFGEVYVLDWGISKLVSEPSTGDALDMEGVLQSSPDALQKRVPTGTLGYMSPEQVRCEPLDPRSDVYGLGLILYEILTGERTHPTRLPQVFYSTLQETQKPSERAPARDVPPELDEACAWALAVEPERRLPSARALGSLVQSYLDGDRDLALRKRRAAEATERAVALLGEAREVGDETKRREAAGQIGIALAFAPQDETVRKVLLEILMDVPTELPDEVRSQLSAERTQRVKRGIVFAAILYGIFALSVGAWLLFAEYALHRPVPVAIGMVAIGLATVGAIVIRRLETPRDLHLAVLYTLSCISLAVLSRTMSPWVLVPVLVITNTFGYILIGGPGLRRFVVLVAVLLVPALAIFDQWGPVEPTTSVLMNGILVDAQIVSGTSVGWLFFAAPIAVAVVSVLFLYSTIRVLEAAELILAQNELQRWRFRQLLPRGVGSKLEIPAMKPKTH